MLRKIIGAVLLPLFFTTFLFSDERRPIVLDGDNRKSVLSSSDILKAPQLTTASTTFSGFVDGLTATNTNSLGNVNGITSPTFNIIASGNVTVNTFPATSTIEIFVPSGGPLERNKIVTWSWSGGGQPNAPYHVMPKSLTWTEGPNILWGGSNDVGQPASIRVMIKGGGSPVTFSVRIYDFTNGNIIAERNGMTNITKGVYDIGTISNISQTEAIWEIQTLSDVNPKQEIHLYGLSIIF